MEREELVERLKDLKDFVNERLTVAVYYGMSQTTLDLWADRRDTLEEAIVIAQAHSKKTHSI